jgi:NitT/TauT family transport system ATP-binding protein/sulfonate transport system ATP-binding protein
MIMSIGFSLRQVSKEFEAEGGRRVSALRDISLECRPGEFLCILGPTGCGKTTLLRLLAGLDHSGSGEILLGNRPVKGVPPEAGLVFQQGALFPWLRTVDNVAFGLRMSGINRRERQQRARRWLSRLGLDGFEKAWPHELSGGMAQRVALARALITEPSILLLDEPFSAVDEKTRYGLQDLLLTLWRQTGATVVFVTHHVEEAVYLGKRIAVLAPPPGGLMADITVDQPQPRDRLSRPFVEKMLQVRQVFEEMIRE